MARALRARAPDPGIPSKPKVLVFGKPSTGKTTVISDLDRLYLIDVEGGAEGTVYQNRLKSRGSAYMGRQQGSQDFDTIIDEVKALATLEHPYLTVAIDSFSKLYNLEASIAEERVGNNFGADKKEAQKPTRQLMRWLERLDMNVILICHEKPIWVRHGKELCQDGVTFDGWDKMNYDWHLALHVTHDGATAVKTRMEGFPLGERFEWSADEFQRRAGRDIMLRPPCPVVLPDKEEVAEVRRLLRAVKVAEDWESKALAKAGVVSWEEMDRAKVQACIKYLTGLVRPEGDTP